MWSYHVSFRFREHSSTVFVEIGTDRNVTNTFEIVKSVLECSQKLLKGCLDFLPILSCLYNYTISAFCPVKIGLSNKKGIEKKTYHLNREFRT